MQKQPTEEFLHYQHIIVHGTAWERGYSHGHQARSKIQTSIERYRSSKSLPRREICFKIIQESYLLATEKHFPDGLQEMQGIAAGAEVDLEDIFLLNARYDLARLTGHMVSECTSMAYLDQSGSAIVAQNWDNSSWLHDMDTIIILESHLKDTEDPDSKLPTAPKRIIALTEAGQLGRSGMNSLGLGLCANSLWSSDDQAPSNRPCLPFTLSRAMYLQCPNFAAGIKTLSTFPRHVSGNLIAASLDVAIDFELAPSRKFLLHPKLVLDHEKSGYRLITHANHFNHPAIDCLSGLRDTYPGGSSLFRDVRLEQLLQMRLHQSVQSPKKQGTHSYTTKYPSPPETPPIDDHAKKTGNHEDQIQPLSLSEPKLLLDADHQFSQRRGITVQDIKDSFSDHASYPRSLCEHHEKGRQIYGAASDNGTAMTVACVIYDLRKGEMHVSRGNPCQGERVWKTLVLEMEFAMS